MSCVCVLRFRSIVAILFSAQFIGAQQPTPSELFKTPIEQLMEMQVTSVSKKEQKISTVAAAIFVITQEDIRRSGATSIPELLRLAPGLDVAQLDGNSWGISSRGFNNRWSNKLLVLIDGRSVYSPVFSGVYWQAIDVPLADIERIEVIRGPGATVWGANAVNGVISIITKSSKDTQGGLVEGSAGTHLLEQSMVRYGGKFGKQGHYRFFADSTANRNNVDVTGLPANDDGHNVHGGFRADWDASGEDLITVEGNLGESAGWATYSGFLSLAPPYQGTSETTSRSREANILGRWTHTFSPRSDTALQMYFGSDSLGSFGINADVKTADLDFQHHFVAGERNDIVWGIGARVQPIVINSSALATFTPSRNTSWLASAFIQDEFEISDSFRLSFGTKVERNDLTGNNLQPGIRAVWSPDKRNSLWGAVSRAISEPSRQDVAVTLNLNAFQGQNGLTYLMSASGNPRIQAENLTAFEVGYRYQPSKKVSMDLAGFFNRYTNLISTDALPPTLETYPQLYVSLPYQFGNNNWGHTYGLEGSATVAVSQRWKLSPQYSWLKTALYGAPTSLNPYAGLGEGPEHQFQVRSNFNVSRNVDFDSSFGYVGPLGHATVPGYPMLDARLAWRFSEAGELSLNGQNLLDPRRVQLGGAFNFGVPSIMARHAYLKLSWRF